MSVLLLAILCLFALLVFTILLLLAYSGLFDPVNVGTGAPPIRRCLFVYKTRKGPYKDCGDLFTEASLLATDKPCLGIYYDDPEEVPAAECRYAVGSIIAKDGESPDTELLEKFSKAGFKCLELPAVDYVVHCTFPYRTAFSIYIGVYRVYPALRYYTESNKLSARPYLELYDNETIHYFAPLSKQDGFYVDEFVEQPDFEPSPQKDDDIVKERSRRSRTPSPEIKVKDGRE